MKKLLSVVAMSAVFAASSAYALENTVKPTVKELGVDTPKSCLIVGNSYSYYNCNIHSWLREFTREAKLEWNSRSLTINSARLSFHNVKEYLKPDKPMDPFAKKDPMFDVVILQTQSSEPITKKNGADENFRQALKMHVADIRKAGSVPLVVAPWAKSDKPEEAKLLADATTQAANDNGILVVPVGLAFSESLKLRPDLLLHRSDKSHPTGAGSYLFGAMLYAAIFKKSPVGYKTLGSCDMLLKPEDAKHLQEVAWKTTKEFYGWK